MELHSLSYTEHDLRSLGWFSTSLRPSVRRVKGRWWTGCRSRGTGCAAAASIPSKESRPPSFHLPLGCPPAPGCTRARASLATWSQTPPSQFRPPVVSVSRSSSSTTGLRKRIGRSTGCAAMTAGSWMGGATVATPYTQSRPPSSTSRPTRPSQPGTQHQPRMQKKGCIPGVSGLSSQAARRSSTATGGCGVSPCYPPTVRIPSAYTLRLVDYNMPVLLAG